MASSITRWLHRQHFDLRDPWEHVDFQVVAAYDVVGAPGWHIEMPVQPSAEMWLVREGTVEICLNDQRAVAHAGTIALLYAGAHRDTREIAGQSLSILGFSFSASLLGALDFIHVLELPLVLAIETQRIQSLIHQMMEESDARQPGYSLAVHGLGQLAFVELLRAHAAQSPEDMASKAAERLKAAQNPELAGAMSYVASHFDEDLDVPRLAQAAHLSVKHFGRKFRGAMGMTPMEYVRRFRLNRARDLLGVTDEPTGTVAARCGFEDAAHFSRAFKREFSLSPMEYRQRMRELTRNSSPKNAPLKSNSGACPNLKFSSQSNRF